MANKSNQPKTTISKSSLKASIATLKYTLKNQQQLVKQNNLPIIVLIDGWGAAGKGSLTGNLIRELDPRFYNVIPMNPPTAEELRKPFLYRYMEIIPEQGKFVFLDGSPLKEVVSDMVLDNKSLDEVSAKINSIKIMERQLIDNGYLVLKFFLDIPKGEQKRRIQKLDQSKNTIWRVNDFDRLQLKDRKKFEKAYKAYMDETSTSNCKWNIIDSTDEKEAEHAVLTILTTEIDKALNNGISQSPKSKIKFPLAQTPMLKDIPLDQEMSKEEYNVRLKELQKKLKKMHNKIYRLRIPVVIAYEGWDAAGKGGNIKRLSGALDPRGFEVFPIAAPLPYEKSRHYLWRFWHRLPKDGHIAIFDRTWYGRVMVERLEGFCSETDWKRAYNEINEFEKELSDWGAVVIKFWIQIDKDTQLARFTERQNTPEKQWKITDEDWRNREKWDEYETAVNEMIQKTSTKTAPWTIISSNNKYYARIQALETVIARLEKAIDEHK